MAESETPVSNSAEGGPSARRYGRVARLWSQTGIPCGIPLRGTSLWSQPGYGKARIPLGNPLESHSESSEVGAHSVSALRTEHRALNL
jgi:hypothetical protein